MNKKVWSIELDRNSLFCIFHNGVILDIGCKGDARVSYTKQKVDIYTKPLEQNVEYRITLIEGCIWGPGILSQMSNMTLKFVMK